MVKFSPLSFTGYKFGYRKAPGQKNMVGVTTGIRHAFQG